MGVIVIDDTDDRTAVEKVSLYRQFIAWRYRMLQSRYPLALPEHCRRVWTAEVERPETGQVWEEIYGEKR